MLDTKKETFWDLLKKSNAFPIKWLSLYICWVAMKQVVYDWNYWVSQLIRYPRVEKTKLFGLFEADYDFQDHQWSHFRGKLIPVSFFFAIFLIYSNILKSMFPNGKRKVLFFLFEFVFVYYLHGLRVFWVFLFLSVSFSLTFLVRKGIPHQLFLWLTWIFPIGLLFFNEYYHEKYDFILHYFPSRYGLSYIFKRTQEYSFRVGFNMMVLKMISFNIDFYLSYHSINLLQSKSPQPPITKSPKGETSNKHVILGEKTSSSSGIGYSESDYYIYNDSPSVDDFTNKNMKVEHYTFLNFLIYSLYPPLYIAGPISSFNNFMSWFHRSASSKHGASPILSKYNIIYFFRFLVSFCLLEFLNSKLFMSSIVFNFKRLQDEDVGVTGWLLVGVGTVFFIHLKFNTIWKYFRLISLLDGIDVYENMNLCVWGYTSIRAFWRDWHKSFYKWNLRYVYFFLGGKSHSIRNMILVFVFVALWHDIHLNLLVYGWVIIFFFLFDDMISMYLHKYFPKKGPNKFFCPGILRRLRIGITSAMLIWTINIGFTGLGQAWLMLKHLCTLRGVHDIAIYIFLEQNVLMFSEIIRTFTKKKVIASEY